MTDDVPLYCTACAAEAFRRHGDSAHSRLPPEFQLSTTGVVVQTKPGLWHVPRAVVVVRGNSLCLAHLSKHLSDPD